MLRAILALSIFFSFPPGSAVAFAGKSLVHDFMDICVLTGADPTSIEAAAKQLGMKEAASTPYPFYKLGKRFNDKYFLPSDEQPTPYAIRLSRSEDSERWILVCGIANLTLSSDGIREAFSYLPAIANLGEVAVIGPAGYSWHSPAWGDGSLISFSEVGYTKPGASIRFVSTIRKP